MEDGKGLVQIDFVRDADPDAANGLAVGGSVTVAVKELDDQRPSDHPVYEWERPELAPKEGVVKAINYARHGEPNGAILESGEFLHLRPEGAKTVKLAIWQKLSFEGEVRTSPSGHAVIEARTVNGVALDRHSEPAKKKYA